MLAIKMGIVIRLLRSVALGLALVGLLQPQPANANARMSGARRFRCRRKYR
jgi:hypothetical protein